MSIVEMLARLRPLDDSDEQVQTGLRHQLHSLSDDLTAQARLGHTADAHLLANSQHHKQGQVKH